MMRDRLNKLASRLPLWKRIHNRMMMSISAQIADIIDEKFNSRREFADSLDKKESELSKWLSGTHNFTLKSLAKIEEKLEVQFLYTSDELSDNLAPYKLDENEYSNTSLKTLMNFQGVDVITDTDNLSEYSVSEEGHLTELYS